MDRSWAKRPGRIDNGFGHQIRSYVMHPYTVVRDLRTDMETADLKSVLDGDIDAFLEAEIIRRKNLRQNPDSAVLD